MIPVESRTKTLFAFMREMKVGRARVKTALTKLGIQDLPIELVEYNEAEMLSVELQAALVQQLQLLPPEKVTEYKDTGHLSAMEIAARLKLTKATVFRHLNAIEPDWKTHYPALARGQRRVVLFPPEMVGKVDRYNQLSNERQMLAAWRSLRQRGALHVYTNEVLDAFQKRNVKFLHRIFIQKEAVAMKAYLQLAKDLPAITDSDHLEMRKSISWGVIGERIQTARDILHLGIADEEMLARFQRAAEISWVFLSLTHIKIPLRIAEAYITTNWGSSRQHHLMEIGFSYMHQLIFKRSSDELSTTDFAQMLQKEVFAHVESYVPEQYRRVKDRSNVL